MTIEIASVTPDQVKRILEFKEGHFLDLKSIAIAPGKLTRTIAAFSNASGGELFIGIEEAEIDGIKTRNWKGFADAEAANGHLQIFEQLFPLGQYYSYGFLQGVETTGLVLQVNVSKTRELMKASDDLVYLRRSAQNLPIKTPEGLERLRLDKGIHSFENETVDAPIEIISNSTPILEFLINVIPTAEPEPWLMKQML